MSDDEKPGRPRLTPDQARALVLLFNLTGAVAEARKRAQGERN